jgi:hypothetical protein
MVLQIDGFIDSQTRAVEKWSVPESPDSAECLMVERVAPTSVASAAGVSAGDLVVSVDDEPATGFSSEPGEELAAHRQYLFYSEDRSEHTRLGATGIDIGAVMCPTVECIDSHFQRGGDISCLDAVWHAGRWETLEELARLELTGKRRRAGTLRRMFTKVSMDTPAALLLGAAQYEQGRIREGLRRIEDYSQKYAKRWKQDYLGIALYYLGLEALRIGDQETAVDRLSLAFTYCGADRIADKLEDLTGTRAEESGPSATCGQLFPFPYRLKPLDSDSGLVSLSATFADMDQERLHAVCLLGGERATREYRAFTYRFRNYVHFAQQYLNGLHVITSCGDGSGVDGSLLRGEELLRELGVPLEVLHDEDGRLEAALKPMPALDVLLLTADGQVFYRGTLDGIDFWNVLAARYS